jgi:putative methyltransferase (TIGR04325 family)
LLLKRLISRIRWEFERIFYFRKAKTWTNALNGTTGYSNPKILEHALSNSMLPKTEKSKDWLELFQEVSTRCNEVEIIDVGGGLGDKYLRYRDFLSSLGLRFSWNIVEQNEWTKAGAMAKHLREINFARSIQELRLQRNCEILVILSSSICYFQEPQVVLKEIGQMQPAWILIDRTPISRRTTPAIQKVRTQKGFYEVPIWFFQTRDLLKEFKNYEIANEWLEDVQPTRLAVFQGLWLRRIN